MTQQFTITERSGQISGQVAQVERREHQIKNLFPQKWGQEDTSLSQKQGQVQLPPTPEQGTAAMDTPLLLPFPEDGGGVFKKKMLAKKVQHV